MKAKNLLLNNKFLGQMMFLVLIIMAMLFYLERTIFVDPCYAVFNFLYYHDYIIEAGRTAATIPQTLPLLAIKLGLPLKVILASYSLSFVVLYYLVYLIIAYGFKLDRLALAVPLVLLIGVKYSYFWISTETQQAVVYTVLFYAFLTFSLRFKPGILFWTIRLAVAAGILLLCFYSHPVSLFTVLFVLGFFVVDNKLWLKPDAYLLGGVIVALAVYKFMTGSSTGYESFFFKGFGDFFNRIGYVFHSESFIFLKVHLFNVFLITMLLFLITTVWYILMKQYLKLAYYLVTLVLFSVVLFTTFNIWFFPFIQEKNLMGLNIFLLIPFLNDVIFTTPKKRLYFQVFIVLMFLLGIFHILQAAPFYRNRLAYIHTLINGARHFPEKKFIVGESMVDRNQLNVNWALAPETLILSSLEGPDSSLSIYVNDNDGKISETTNLDDSLLFICAPWAKDLEIRRLNRRYFDLRHSSYRTLTEKDMLQGEEFPFYTNRFDDPAFIKADKGSISDSTGNHIYLLTSEFSPGFYGKCSDVSKHSRILITAKVRVFPYEKLISKWLNLVISKEQNQVVLEYHRSGIDKPDSLNIGQWNTLNVSGIISGTDPRDQLKIYLWNPEKKKVGMDDLEITYRVIYR